MSATVTQSVARSIMGDNFLGVEEVSEHFDADFTKDDLRKLEIIPFTRKELEERRDTHVLVAGYPLSIKEIRHTAPRLFCTGEEAWYDEYPLAKEEVNLRWYLVRKGIVKNSTNKNWGEQQAMLGKNEEAPRACVLVYAIVLFALVRGVRLFQKTYARTASTAKDGYCFDVGSLDKGGLKSAATFPGNKWGDVGIASSVMPSSVS